MYVIPTQGSAKDPWNLWSEKERTETVSAASGVSLGKPLPCLWPHLRDSEPCQSWKGKVAAQWKLHSA